MIEGQPFGDGEGVLQQSVGISDKEHQAFETTAVGTGYTLTQWMVAAMSSFADSPAVVNGEATLTYQQFCDHVERFASGLYKLGVRPKDVISVQLPNSIEFLIAYFAITRLGGVLSTIHMPYRTAEITTLLRHACSVALICQSKVKDFSPALEGITLTSELRELKHVISVGEPASGAIPFEKLLRTPMHLPAGIEPQPADPFLLLFTSGTSAGPKAVPLHYEMTLANARVGAKEHGLRKGDRIMSVAPFTHLLGLYSLHLATRVAGANIIFPTFTPADLASAIHRHRPTVLICAPAHLNGLIASGQLNSTDLSSIRLIITAGSTLSPEVAKAISARLPNGFLTNLWGMTELQAGLYTRPTDSFEIATTTSGRPAPGALARIADLEDNSVGLGEEGELQVKGDLLFRGYYRNEDATRNAFTTDGWFRTGDLAVMDEGGNIRITGRKTDIINRGGIKYNPIDIENALARHLKVAEVAVVPFPDPILGQRACCFIVPKEINNPPTLEDLCAHLIECGTSKVKLPERLELIDEMPMTPTRKIIRGRLTARLAEPS